MNIYIVDDDKELQSVISLIIRGMGHNIQSFSTATSFISVVGDLSDGCVLLDLCLPDIDGLAVQAKLAELGSSHAVVLLTGFGDVPDAVIAMRAGAVDFLRKPFRRAELLDAISRAQEKLEQTLSQKAQRTRVDALDLLSERERDVLKASASGKSSKQVAIEMQLSFRTVEMYRAKILKKLDVPNFGTALLVAKTGGLLE